MKNINGEECSDENIIEFVSDDKYICKDNYVGEFEIKNGIVQKLDTCYFSAEERIKHLGDCNIENLIKLRKKETSNNKRIVVILESPHKEEYKFLNLYKAIKLPQLPSMPAMGHTGTKLQENFINSVKVFLKDGCYDIILMNGVQYQCSLGDDTDKHRDRIWLKMWLEEEKDKDLIRRLEEYKPDIIFNLCTNGGHKKDEKLITNSIDEKYLGKILEEVVFEKIKDGKSYLSVSRLKDVTLRRFVQKAINEYKYKNDKNNEVELFWGNHPSSRGGNNKIINKILPVELKYMNLKVLKNQAVIVIHLGVLEAINEVQYLESQKIITLTSDELASVEEVEKLEKILLDLKKNKLKCSNNSSLLVGFEGIESIVIGERDKELAKIKAFKIKKL